MKNRVWWLLVAGVLIGCSDGGGSSDDGDTDSDADADADSDSDADGDTDGDSDSDTDADTDADGDTDLDTECPTVDGVPSALTIPREFAVELDPASALVQTETAGGPLSATGAAAATGVELPGLNYDLNTGYRDTLDVRLQLPVGYTGGVTLAYMTSESAAPSADREIELLSADLSADGAVHTYRIDLSYEQRWRGQLTGLRISTTDALGDPDTLTVASVLIGDPQGDVYVTQAQPPETTGLPVVLSKHFAVYYDPADYPVAKVPGTIRNLEEMWGFYHKVLKLKDTGLMGANGELGRINVFISADTCYACAGGLGMGLQPGAAEPDPPSWAIAHELAHNFQSQNNGIDGQYYENFANYCRERYIRWYAHLFGENPSNFESGYTMTANLDHGNGIHYYLSWPVFMYMDDNPDNLEGLGDGTAAAAFVEAVPGESFYTALTRVTDVSPQDIIGYTARRNVTWNYAQKTALNKAASAGDALRLERKSRAELRRRPDLADWWQVPQQMAPLQSGYAISELVPEADAQRVVVTFRGLEDSAAQAGWRASIVVVGEDGQERYSPLFSSGSHCVNINSAAEKVYLAVAGTPDSFGFLNWDETIQSAQSAPEKARMLYEVKLEGATPEELSAVDLPDGVPHPNGGGLVSPWATVAATAWVGPDARVMDSAQVLDNARIEDYAVVRGAARVEDNAIVSGHAVVRDSAAISGNAKVRDYADVWGNSEISGDARLLEHSESWGFADVRENATFRGKSGTYADADNTYYAGGWMIADGEYTDQRTVTSGYHIGFMPWNGSALPEWVAAFTSPQNLQVAMTLPRSHESLALDSLGLSHGYLAGAPTWQAEAAPREGSLSLDGVNDYVLLDRAVADHRSASYAVWVKPDTLGDPQPVLYLGNGDDRYLLLQIDAQGQPTLTATNGVDTTTLAGTTALVAGEWTLLTVTLGDGQAEIFMDAQSAATGATTIRPDMLLSADTPKTPQVNYLGRDPGNGRFSGAIGGFMVYVGAIDAARVAGIASGTL